MKNSIPDCIICGSRWNLFHTKRDSLGYYRCPGCSFIYLHPDHHPDPEVEKKRYLLHDNSMENTGYVEMLNRFIQDFILPRIRPPAVVLDFGSGPEPVLSNLLKQRGFSCDSYDPYFASFQLNMNNQYDLIILFEVIEHLTDPVHVMSALFSLLHDGKYCVISTLFHPEQSDRFETWWYRRDITHRSFFSAETFYTLAERTGFLPVQTDGKQFIVLKKK